MPCIVWTVIVHSKIIPDYASVPKRFFFFYLHTTALHMCTGVFHPISLTVIHQNILSSCGWWCNSSSCLLLTHHHLHISFHVTHHNLSSQCHVFLHMHQTTSTKPWGSVLIEHPPPLGHQGMACNHP